MFLQQLVTGISIGSVYALLAVGYALVFSVFNFSNFGFGPVMMLGAFAAFYAIPALNLPLFPSILLAMVVAGLVSFIMELTVYRPMRQKKTLKLYLMIAGLGINTFVPNAAIQIFGGGVHAFPSDWARVTRWEALPSRAQTSWQQCCPSLCWQACGFSFTIPAWD